MARWFRDQTSSQRKQQSSLRQGIQSLSLLLLLAASAAAGSLFYLPLFYGLHFTFGLVPLLLAVVWLGLPAALITAVALASVTSLQCGHPFVFALIGAQVVFLSASLAWARRAGRERPALPLLIGLFWLLLGTPLTLACTLIGRELSIDTALLSLLTHVVNDIINAVLAELVLILVAVLQRRPASISHRDLLFTLINAGTLLPAATLILIGTRDLQYRLESELTQQLQLFGAAAEEMLIATAAQSPAPSALAQATERLESRLAQQLPQTAEPSIQRLPLVVAEVDDLAHPFAQHDGLQLINATGEPPINLVDWQQVRYRFSQPLAAIEGITGLRIELNSEPLIDKVHAWLRPWLVMLTVWTAIALIAAAWLSRWLAKPLQDLIAAAESLPALIDSGAPMPALPPSRIKEQVMAARALTAIGERLQASFTRLVAERDQEREQRALRRDHQFMLDALSQAETGIIITERTGDGNHPVRFVSKGFESLTGYTLEEMLGQDCRILQGTDRDQPERQALRAALAEGKPCRTTLRNYRKDGSLFWNTVNLTPVIDAEGRITHYIGVQRDDTERREALERLSANEARLLELTETIEEVFWVYEFEQDRLTYVSRAFETIWERPIAAVCADRNVWRESIHPADREQVLLSREALVTGGHLDTVEYRILTPAGELKWIADRRFLIRDAAGRPCRVVGVAAEITDRKAVEKALWEQRQRLEQIIEGARVGTWDWRLQSGEIRCNDRWAEMLGYTLTELQPTNQTTWKQRLHPDDQPSIEQHLKAHLDGDTALFECEFRMQHKAGHWVWIQSTGRIVERSPDGQALRMIGIHLEISERKQAELELIARERLERELVALTTAFVGPTTHAAGDLIQQTLAKIGQLTSADRAYLFLADSGTESFSNTDEWVAPGVTASIDSLQGIRTSELGPMLSLLTEAEAVVIASVADLGEDWALLRKDLERQQIQSLLLVPLMDKQGLMGFVGLDAVRQQRDWARSDLHLLSGLAGALVGALQRERVLADLRSSTERYDALALQSRMMTWEIDSDGVYTYVNPVAKTLLGYAPETLIGHKAFYDLIPEPERAALKAKAFALMQQSQPWNALLCPLLKADRQRLWTSVDGQPIFGADGSLRGYRGSTLDVTDVQQAERQRRTAEQALQHYAENLEHLVDLSNRGLEPTDEAAALLEIANEALDMAISETGWRRPNKPYHRLVRIPANAAEPSGLAARAVTEALFADPDQLSDQPRLITGELVPKPIRAQGYSSLILLASRWPSDDSPPRWLVTQLWSARPHVHLSSAERELLRFISQRIATIQHEAQLAQDLVNAKERETIGHLASGVAHDFNNVLAVLDANLYFLRSFVSSSPADDESHQVIDEMTSVLGQAKVITSGMLALSRAGGVPLRPTPLEPPLTELSDILRMMLPESVHWQLEIEPGLSAKTSAGFLQAALLNLALNGRDAMPEGGELSITAQRKHWPGYPSLMVGDLSAGDYAIIQVSDTGSGIPEPVIQRMFEPLFSTKTQQRGHGLGLFMVREFVSRSGAGLTVRSTLGRGTQMQFLLPLA
ncbi:PAS domain-containing protein [Lamprobacter modestohalophilus]|uniref:PAS domain-containing protein n=1 Tax=Lamprobacter modestohalophilus TaxID=1064514 RepID=UPI002ADEEB29|nr:PAS domain-containing protein [Lamprobacter modestohalophilus]MEA1051917.1 PAS domain-containing protein [Lamprobacter modestohalophilus]